MPDETEPKTIDRRVAARMVRKGQLNERELEKSLKTLPDIADRAAPVETHVGDEDDDEG